ncbi:hypothetical protein ACS0TY_034462 [Phlomoides rotata]
MRKECDLVDGSTDLSSIPDSKLPFGEWLKASPMKQATVRTNEQRRAPVKKSLRKQFFKRFKQSIHEEDSESDS